MKVEVGEKMNGYIKSSVCHSVSGFIRYCRTGTKKDRDDYVTEYSTAPFGFWSELAKENRIRHKENKLNKNKKAVEGRQLMVRIDKDNHITAEQFAKHLKKTLGVEVFVFEHWKGNNRHFHIIIADRTKLKEPIPVRLSSRTYYYDEKGKKCKKADAVKVVPKGTVLNAEQKFSEKIDEFRTKGWLEDLKSELFDYLEMTKFDNENQFAFETIGTQKVKSDDVEYISAAKERNKFRAELNIYLSDESTPSKKEFCEYCGISPRTKYIPNAKINEIREKFGEFEKLYPLNEKTAQNRFESVTDTTVDKNTNNQTVQEPKDEVETPESLSDDELISDYTYMTKWLSSAKSDLSDVFIKYDCPYTRLERNSYWEQHKNFPVKWYDVDYSINRVNKVIENNNLEIEKIPENKATATRAYNQATNVFELLKRLIEELKKYIEELFAEIKNRGLENKEINRNEIEQDEEYEKE